MVLAGDIFGGKDTVVRSKGTPMVSGMDIGAAGFYQGLESISSTATKIRRNMELNQRVDSLLKKQQLTHQDSLWLSKALKVMER